MPVLETPLIAATGKLASSDKSSSATSIGHTDAGDIPLFLLQAYYSDGASESQVSYDYREGGVPRISR